MEDGDLWTLYRSFLAVAQHGSLSRGGQAIGLSQPTIGRHIDALERSLRASLFTRAQNGLSPTDAALELQPYAESMEASSRALLRAVASSRDEIRGTVRITASEIIGAEVLPPILADLQRDHPQLVVELVLSNRTEDLLRREADIAVRMVRPAQASLVARKIGDVPICAAAHRSYLDTFGTPRRPDDLLRHRLIGYDHDDTIERGFAAMGFPIGRETFVLRTDDQVAYGQLVAAGAGIGFVARYNIAHWPGVEPLLPVLAIPPLPCWLALWPLAHLLIHITSARIAASGGVRTAAALAIRSIPGAKKNSVTV